MIGEPSQIPASSRSRGNKMERARARGGVGAAALLRFTKRTKFGTFWKNLISVSGGGMFQTFRERFVWYV